MVEPSKKVSMKMSENAMWDETSTEDTEPQKPKKYDSQKDKERKLEEQKCLIVIQAKMI